MILLSRNDAFSWHELLESYLKGYFYDEKIGHEAILKELSGFSQESEYISYFKNLNGEFSFLRETENYIVAAVDFARAFPLFYSFNGNDLIVSDSADRILAITKEKTLDELALRELRIAGTTFGSRTLYNEIKTLGAGELIFFDKTSKTFRVTEYMDFDEEACSNKSLEDLTKELREVYSSAIEKALRPLGNRTIVVPLTSGWWQRLLIDKIKAMGLKNVICYSYGAKDTKEIGLAREIAEYYGYPWHFVEYKANDWFKWFNGSDYKKYKEYAASYVSVPIIREYLALKNMKEKKIVPDDAVFINVCFTGVLRGELIPSIFLNDVKGSKDLVKYEIMRELASNLKWKRKDNRLVDDYISDIFQNYKGIDSVKERSDLWKFKYAYWKERVAKHQSGARRIYEYFGFEWRNIQLDKEIVDFWNRVPAKVRYENSLQVLYDKTYDKKLLEAIGMEEEKMRKINSDFLDIIRLKLPKQYRKIDFNRRTKKLKNAYDKDELLWFNIVSRREFDRYKENITDILAVQSLHYLREFLNRNNFSLKNDN